MSKVATTPTCQSYASSSNLGFTTSRRGANAWHEVLDLCKNGFASKMESISAEITANIRAEVTDAVNTFQREASSATLASDRPIGAQLLRMEENVQKIEKLVCSLPPPPDLAPLHKNIQEVEGTCLGAVKQLGERLEQVSWTMQQMTNKMHDGSLQGGIQRLDDKLAQIELKVQQSVSNVGTDVSKVQQHVSSSTTQIMSEVQKLQFEDEQHFSNLDKTCAEAGREVQKGLEKLTGMSDKISDQISCSGSDISHLLLRIESAMKNSDAKLLDVQGMQRSLQDTIAKEVQKAVKQDDKHYTAFGLTLETSASDQRLMLKDIQETMQNLDFVAIVNDMMKARVQQRSEFGTVLGELAKVQQALHIDYLKVTNEESAGLSIGDSKEMQLAGEETTRAKATQRRVREFFTQTVPKDRKDTLTQTDPVQFEEKDRDRLKKRKMTKKIIEPKVTKAKTAFAGADRLKQAAKEASMKPPYNVFDYYHQDGCAQRIAKSSVFENCSLLIVLLNAFWISVDTDSNDAAVLIDAAPVFQVMENLFCTYFTMELAVRFAAFSSKRNCFKDAWFIFDTVLVSIMIVETWGITGVMLALDFRIDEGSSDVTSTFKIVKMVKLIRLSRMARLLRTLPELIIIIKGLSFAARSVCVFFLLWGMIVYVFAILFRQITEDSAVGQTYFKSVPDAMNTLLLNGVFADNANLVSTVSADNWVLWPILIFFMALVSLTLMYMLVGVLVDVVGVVATSEKEGMAVSLIASNLRTELQRLGFKDDAEITQSQFQNLMLDAGTLKVIQSVGVDVVVLADMLDLVFEQFSKGTHVLRFPDLVEMVLSMRGTNPATVKDCKEQIRVTKALLKDAMDSMLVDLRHELGKIQGEGHTASPSDSEVDIQ